MAAFVLFGPFGPEQQDTDPVVVAEAPAPEVVAEPEPEIATVPEPKPQPPPEPVDPYPDLSTFTDCAECPTMVVIPAGTFLMGSPEDEEGRDADEGPQRRVSVPKFALAQTEVTFDQWQACVNDGGCQSTPTLNDWGWGRGSRPVINVRWNDAQEYVAWLNRKVAGSPYRLPSEAEWEYAARAGTTGRFSNDGDEAEFCSIGNHADQETDYSHRNTACTDGFGKQTAPVADFQPNGFGLYDMHGNVWEWGEDVYGPYDEVPTDGSAHLPQPLPEDHRRVVRGGSWGSGPQYLRSANRGGNVPEVRYNNIGFRPARTLLTR